MVFSLTLQWITTFTEWSHCHKVLNDDIAKICNTFIVKHCQNKKLSEISWFENSHSASKLKRRERENHKILRNFCKYLLELYQYDQCSFFYPSALAIINLRPNQPSEPSWTLKTGHSGGPCARASVWQVKHSFWICTSGDTHPLLPYFPVVSKFNPCKQILSCCNTFYLWACEKVQNGRSTNCLSEILSASSGCPYASHTTYRAVHTAFWSTAWWAHVLFTRTRMYVSLHSDPNISQYSWLIKIFPALKHFAS